MCGIAGYWNFGSGIAASEGVIRAMTETLVHRGPDEGDVWLEGSLALGIRRLRVIDPAGGRQPLANEVGTVRVVFNGEIYNHREIRARLESLGHRFRTRSDTEVIVHGYEEWGPECVERFNGMFAFAVWDAGRQRLLLARDRLGIKPLYLHESADGLVFGSELKSVLTAPWVPFDWDLEALDEFLTYEYVPAPRSIVKAISKVPPATTVLYSRDGRRQARRFWALSPADPPGSVAEATAGLRQRLATSVERRLLADVPVGAFLSGGIDSSAVVDLAATKTRSALETFTIGFADRSYDERPFAASVAEAFRTQHRERVVDPDVVDLAERLAAYLDEPFADVSSFPTYLVSRYARESVTVALSGDGGDELFAGYDQYRADRWANRLRWLTASSSWTVVDRLLQQVPPTARKKGAVNVAKRFAEGIRHPVDLEHARWWIFAGPLQRRALFSAEMGITLADHDPFEHYRGRLREGAEAGFSGLQRQLYADLTGYLPDDILTKVDRMSMAVSLEARVPFLDHEVVEYGMSIPADWKLRGRRSKWILKEAFRARLPHAVLSRRKQGFSMPMKSWLRGPLEPLLHELTEARAIRERGWFDAAEVQRLVREHVAGSANHAHQLWCIMSVELSARHLGDLVRGRARVPEEIPA